MCARMPIVSVLVTCRSVPGPGARGRSLVQRANKQTNVALHFICHVMLGCITERIRSKFQTAKVTKHLRVDIS